MKLLFPDACPESGQCAPVSMVTGLMYTDLPVPNDLTWKLIPLTDELPAFLTGNHSWM